MSTLANKFLWFAIAHQRWAVAILAIMFGAWLINVGLELYILHLFETQAIPQLEHDLQVIHPTEWSA